MNSDVERSDSAAAPDDVGGRMSRDRLARVLTIAGSDSGGGAGIQADLKTFAAFGTFGMSAVTAITAQNTRGVHAARVLEPRLVTAQIDAVFDDLGVDAVKTGMLGDAAVIEAVVAALRGHAPAVLVVDPVMVATSGDRLLAPAAEVALIQRLVPMATCVTPNLGESAVLVGHPVDDEASMVAAGRALLERGACAALIKGGHLDGDAADVLVEADGETWLRSPRIDTRNTHGTGCTLSAALAAALARGLDLATAAAVAKRYVSTAIVAAPNLGAGHGPLWHGVEPEI